MKLDKIENIVMILFGVSTFLGGIFFIITEDPMYVIPTCFSFMFLMFIPLLLRFATLKYFLATKHPELTDFKDFDFDDLQKKYKRLRKEQNE